MNAKSFLFVGAWVQPLKTLPLEQRWNVLEAIVEYSTSGEVTLTLDAMESLAFTFIRHEIDRMKEHRAELRETRRESANKRWKKEQKAIAQATEEASHAIRLPIHPLSGLLRLPSCPPRRLHWPPRLIYQWPQPV